MEYKYILALVGIGLIASTVLFSHEINGPKLWLQVGPVSLQPSEFARVVLIIFFAGYLADKLEQLAATSRSFLGFQIPRFKYFGPVVLV
jgi:cell division protein FtsW (lipid II flippase)